jgi:hypothetical protein
VRKGPTPLRLLRYVRECLGLAWYLDDPGDGRRSPQIPAPSLLWALVVGKVLRVASFHGLEAVVRLTSPSLGVGARFGDDTLAYFTERLSVDRLRQALAALVQRAKRNKVFEEVVHLGLALDGTGAGRSQACRCGLCRPQGGMHTHWLCAISVVGPGALDLPFDAQYYGPGQGELTTGKRLLKRAVGQLGRRFATYVVGDGLYASAPFIHEAQELGLAVVLRLKDNLPELYQAARDRFHTTPAHQCFDYKRGVVELWDADDFDPWEGLRWPAVRVLRYRHRRADGTTFDAYWLTSFAPEKVGPRALFRMAKSRWGIENHGFNDAKNRYGLKHIPHHEPNSIRVHTLLTFLAICVERLYRLRYLRRGSRAPYTAIQLCRLLWLSLGPAFEPYDTS